MLGGHPRHQQLKNGPKASFRPKALICRELCLKMPLFVVFQVVIIAIMIVIIVVDEHKCVPAGSAAAADELERVVEEMFHLFAGSSATSPRRHQSAPRSPAPRTI
jgi:hypothetical protein